MAEKIHVDELELGMFVSELDIPWTDTPFMLQGLTVSNAEELATLRNLCTFVYIDTALSRSAIEPHLKSSLSGGKPAKAPSKAFADRKLVVYEDVFTFQAEVGTADRVFNDYGKVVGRMYSDIAENGKVDMAAINGTVTDVVDSIVRNPDACMLLSAIREKDSYSYSHAMSSSVFAAALGRQVGLPVHDLKSLATGALLCDIGKLKIPSSVLNKAAALTADELEQVRAHVALGLEILENTPGVSLDIKDIVANHHERYNGQGYPNGLEGSSIPPLARLAGMVDAYDAMVSDRSYARGISPARAISLLYSMRDREFESELVEEFIQAVGIYPVGSLVELNNGMVGVVVAEHRRRRLRPRLLMLLDEQKQRFSSPYYIDLLERTHDKSGRPLSIQGSVDPGKYDIRPDQLEF